MFIQNVAQHGVSKWLNIEMLMAMIIKIIINILLLFFWLFSFF